MNLRDRIDADMKQAMRDKDALKRDCLRMVVAEFKNKRIELGRDLDEGEQLALIKKAVRSREESAAEYAKAERPELAEQETAEAQLLSAYLPQQLDEAATRDLVAKIAAELGLTEKKQMGALIKGVMAKHKSEVDGKLVSKLAGDVLG